MSANQFYCTRLYKSDHTLVVRLLCCLLRLILIAKRKAVQEKFPIPLINRLEKHFLAMSTVLNPWQRDMADELSTWVISFANVTAKGRHFSEGDAFIGYHGDTAAAVVLRACAYLSKDGSEVREIDVDRRNVLDRAKFSLMQMCPPDALARLSSSQLVSQAEQCWHVYFSQQKHARSGGVSPTRDQVPAW